MIGVFQLIKLPLTILEANNQSIFQYIKVFCLQRTFFLFFIILLFISCHNPNSSSNQWITLQGNAQGTTFRIVYHDSLSRDFSHSIDSILKNIDLSFSTYVPHSTISLFNHNTLDTITYKDYPFFNDFFYSVHLIHKQTNGYFDPFIKPLVNFWGFGEKYTQISDSISDNTIDSILSFKNLVSLNFEVMKEYSEDKTTVQSFEYLESMYKLDERCMLDLNAVAQGYTVDVISRFLDRHAITQYMIEVGGEIKTKGTNKEGKLWRIGIDKPQYEHEKRKIEGVVSLSDMSLATSGNYRKYYEKNGQKYAHIINPKTGFPVTHNTLSVTVIHKDCYVADALATAIYCMGKDTAQQWYNSELAKTFYPFEYFLIYENQGEFQHFKSSGFPNIQ